MHASQVVAVHNVEYRSAYPFGAQYGDDSEHDPDVLSGESAMYFTSPNGDNRVQVRSCGRVVYSVRFRDEGEVAEQLTDALCSVRYLARVDPAE